MHIRLYMYTYSKDSFTDTIGRVKTDANEKYMHDIFPIELIIESDWQDESIEETFRLIFKFRVTKAKMRKKIW